MAFVVKAALGSDADADLYAFDEKTMYGGKHIRVDDEIFVFASDHQGGRGLCAKGIVTSVEPGPGIRVSIKVRPVAKARRNLGRSELKPYRDLVDQPPQTEIARKLYRQATNKIARVSDRSGRVPAHAFLANDARGKSHWPLQIGVGRGGDAG
jgi:hypothetical protein